MAISVTVNKQNIKYDKLIANTLHLMPLGILASKICINRHSAKGRIQNIIAVIM